MQDNDKEKKSKKPSRFRRWLPLFVILLGVGVMAFPFAQNYWYDYQASRLIDRIDTGQMIIEVPEEKVSQGDMDSWAEEDGLDEFDYEEYDDEEFFDDALLTDMDATVGEAEETAVGEIALDGNEQAEVLDVLGLKRKRLVAIGKLRIDSIDLDLPVVEGAGKTELKYAVGHVAGTADFAATGNCVLAGHRNYTYGSMFNRLNEVSEGDTITLTMRDGTVATYQVFETLEIKPGASSTTDFYKDERRLTLVTCTPLGVGSHRLLVRADLVSIS